MARKFCLKYDFCCKIKILGLDCGAEKLFYDNINIVNMENR